MDNVVKFTLGLKQTSYFPRIFPCSTVRQDRDRKLKYQVGILLSCLVGGLKILFKKEHTNGQPKHIVEQQYQQADG